LSTFDTSRRMAGVMRDSMLVRVRPSGDAFASGSPASKRAEKAPR